MNKMSIKHAFMLVIVASLLFSGLTGWSLFRLEQKREEATRAYDARYSSYLLADELRQSSDDLTRLARTYVVTADPAYEEQYNTILDIRNGKKPRPQHYERIYWDFIAAGENVPATGPAVPLLELMRRQGFTAQELGKLKEAQNNSDNLVKTEVIAMNAVKGRYDEGAGKFTRNAAPDLEMARKIMHDRTYHQNKAVIMHPLNEFLQMLDERTSRDVAIAERSTVLAYWQAGVFLVLSLLSLLVSLLLLYRSIRVQLQQAIDVVEKIADGDLTATIDTSRNDEIAKLIRAMGAITRNLTGMIGEIRRGVSRIGVAADEIATGNTDLAERTESQANSLQETAASMETLTDTVRQNADNAREANQLVVSASQVAGQGGKVIFGVVETMGHIKESSGKIVEIISVIDGIAFQTNILALNAAVEAARAGEQGRGFAVVAAEVRSLAQRSASAAKEIKELINTSVERVEHGNRQVAEAGQTTANIVQSVQKVAQIMAQIASASQEQSSGIGEVNHAVSVMDDITHKNASLVKQAEVAARSLKEQATALSRAVSVFKLSEDIPGSAMILFADR